MSSTQSRWTHQPLPHADRSGVRRRIGDQAELLGTTPLFRDLSKRHLREIAKVSATVHADDQVELVKEGAAGSVFYLIVEGTAKVVRGGRTVMRLGPGDFFGEMALLTSAPRTASVIAQSPLRCITLSAKDLRSVLLDNPQIALRMLATMADRLAELDRRLVH